MGIRERILTIRLIEKIRANPTVGKALGIEAPEKETTSGHRPGEEKKEESRWNLHSFK